MDSYFSSKNPDNKKAFALLNNRNKRENTTYTWKERECPHNIMNICETLQKTYKT